MAEHRRCAQTRCGYYLNGGCKECDGCKAKSLIINPLCQRCIKCEGVEDELRFGDKDTKTKESELVPKGIIVLMGEKPKKRIMEEELMR